MQINDRYDLHEEMMACALNLDVQIGAARDEHV
jgi:hypothetical protein